MINTLKILHIIYLLVLIFAPLTFGNIHYWSLPTVKMLSLFSLGLLLVHQLTRRAPLVYVPGLLPLLLLAFWVALQAVPLPAGLVALISPQTYAVYQGSLGIVPTDGLAIAEPSPRRPRWRNCSDWSPPSLFYVLSVQLLTRKQYLKTTLKVVTAFIVALSIIAIVGRLTGFGPLFWLSGANISGPYESHRICNHLAGLLVMMLPVMVSMFLLKRPAIHYESIRESLSGLVNRRTSNNGRALMGSGRGRVHLGHIFQSFPRDHPQCFFCDRLVCVDTGKNKRASQNWIQNLTWSGPGVHPRRLVRMGADGPAITFARRCAGACRRLAFRNLAGQHENGSRFSGNR